MWDVAVYFPTTETDYTNLVNDFQKLWQFPYCFGAIGACHIPIECPPGGQEYAKEYRNFKDLYSIVLMPIVDSKYRFIRKNCGIPGNSNDSTIFQASELYWQITENNIIPNIGNIEDGH